MRQSSIFEKARTFIYQNARLLDRKRYEYHFEGGSKEEVVAALRAYRNEDGGFGNALEPDIRCPQSQPVPTEMALAMMDEMDGFDSDILEGIIRYFSAITLPDGGVPLVFHVAADYPHAPWWATEPGGDQRPSVNPTGSILGWLYKQKVRPEFANEGHVMRSASYMWREIETGSPSGYHEGVHWISFLQHAPDQDRARRYWPKIDKWLGAKGTIELDPHAEGYVHKVLDWAPTPDSYARKFVSDDDVHLHLRELVRQQQEDGGWTISWPPLSPATEQDWRGLLTVERLKTLKAYGML